MCVLSVEQKMVCHGEHTYLFAQAMMSILAQEEQGGSVVRRIGQEVQKFALQRCSKISNNWPTLIYNLLAVQDDLKKCI